MNIAIGLHLCYNSFVACYHSFHVVIPLEGEARASPFFIAILLQ
jgi:hypothetical protein